MILLTLKTLGRLHLGWWLWSPHLAVNVAAATLSLYLWFHICMRELLEIEEDLS